MNFEDYKIGYNNDLIELGSCDENLTLATMLVEQSSRTLEIISRLLDPMIFNAPEFVTAIRNMVTRNRMPKIRVIVFDPETIVRNGHRLIELAANLSSFIEIRKAGRDSQDYNRCLLVADDTAYLHRINGERYEALANFNDRRQSKFYKDEFEVMWTSATPDPNLRRIAL